MEEIRTVKTRNPKDKSVTIIVTKMVSDEKSADPRWLKPTMFTTFEDESGEWRWRAKRGARITASSGESFAKRSNAERAMHTFVESMFAGEIKEEFV